MAIFFATQEANRDTLSEADFLALGKPHDLEILRSFEGRSLFTLLHVCKSNVMAELVADFPGPCRGLEDRRRQSLARRGPSDLAVRARRRDRPRGRASRGNP